MKEVIDSIEAFHLKEDDGGVISPERTQIKDGNNTGLLMPSFHGDYYSVKLVGSAPNNKRLPTIQGIMSLYDRQTMNPLLACDAIPITNLRTGALGGLAMKYLISKATSTLGIIGTGAQGWSHLEAAIAVRPIKSVIVYNRTESRGKDFIEKAQKYYPDITFSQQPIVELIKNSEVVVTATTSKTPILPKLDHSYWKGKLLVAVGSFRPDMQEISDDVLQKAANTYVDTDKAWGESGDMIQAKQHGHAPNSSLTLKHIINHPPEIKNELTIFKSVGDSVFDLITTKTLYEKIKQT